MDETFEITEEAPFDLSEDLGIEAVWVEDAEPDPVADDTSDPAFEMDGAAQPEESA
jgi:hypothetical protein